MTIMALEDASHIIRIKNVLPVRSVKQVAEAHSNGTSHKWDIHVQFSVDGALLQTEPACISENFLRLCIPERFLKFSHPTKAGWGL